MKIIYWNIGLLINWLVNREGDPKSLKVLLETCFRILCWVCDLCLQLLLKECLPEVSDFDLNSNNNFIFMKYSFEELLWCVWPYCFNIGNSPGLRTISLYQPWIWYHKWQGGVFFWLLFVLLILLCSQC